MGNFKEALSAESGTEKAGIFPVFIAVAQGTVVCLFQVQLVALTPAVGSERLTKTVFKTGIDVDGKKRISDGDATQTFIEEPEEGEAVGSP
jgi:hypothetical protein